MVASYTAHRNCYSCTAESIPNGKTIKELIPQNRAKKVHESAQLPFFVQFLSLLLVGR
jgi:hypothetical protein